MTAVVCPLRGDERVCIIGGGITGLGAAYLLQKHGFSEFTLYEANERLGGHANAVEVHGVLVDTGFLVFNELTYPNMIRLFEEEGVASEPSCMSLAVDSRGEDFQWSSSLSSFFPSVSSALEWKRWSLLREISRFHSLAQAELADESMTSVDKEKETVGEFLDRHGLSREFFSLYLEPMVGAVWSAGQEDVLVFPVRNLLRFFRNHHLLQLTSHPQWRTVTKSSRSYVDTISAPFRDKVRLSSPVKSVQRTKDGGWEVKVGGEVEVFDHVILATHSDVTLRLLGDSCPKAVLEPLRAIPYQRNKAYLHRDASLMPRDRSLWASWNVIKGIGALDVVTVTYWLNLLQNLDESVVGGNLFVTLNPASPPPHDLTLAVFDYDHPQFGPASLQAQAAISRHEGHEGLWFAGAYLGNGFHEDGLISGLRVASLLTGRPAPWWGSSGKVDGVEDGKGEGMGEEWKREERKCKEEEDDIGGSEGGGGGGEKEVMLAVPGTVEAVLHSSRPRMPPPDRSTSVGYTTLTPPMTPSRTPTSCTSSLFAYPVHWFLSSTVKSGCVLLRDECGHESLFGDAHSPDRVRIVLQSAEFYTRVALEGELGLARSFLAGDWACDSIPLFLRILVRDREKETRAPFLSAYVSSLLASFSYHLFLNNSPTQAEKKIAARSDLSNNLFAAFLDPSMTYSCALFSELQTPKREPGEGGGGEGGSGEEGDGGRDEHTTSLDQTLHEAQLCKIDTILRRADVQQHHSLLDIGCGWGGLAIRAATTIGCNVVGITLSRKQFLFTKARIEDLGLEEKIQVHFVDYRHFAADEANKARFDRIVSVEMIEAVGDSHMQEYVGAIDTLFAPKGQVCLQAITIPESRWELYASTTDYISSVVFPGGQLVTPARLLRYFAEKSLCVQTISSHGHDYAETLRHWEKRFSKATVAVRNLGFDDDFIRGFRYYFNYCEAAFEEDAIDLKIISFQRPGGK